VSNTSHMCDDCINIHLGMFKLSGMCTAYLLVHGAVFDKKLLVRPESKIAVQVSLRAVVLQPGGVFAGRRDWLVVSTILRQAPGP
jgi:hypothetical protein